MHKVKRIMQGAKRVLVYGFKFAQAFCTLRFSPYVLSLLHNLQSEIQNPKWN